jgi:hypothetical protein
MQADYERAVVEHTIDLLIVDDALAGLVETILRPDHLWIENVAVAPEQQGEALGASCWLTPSVAPLMLGVRKSAC